MEEQEKHMHAIFYGQVQGVFFRATARDIAQRMGLTGTVKNMPEGSVEVHAQGKEEDLEAFAKKLSQEFYLDPNLPVKKNLMEPIENFEDFRIVY